MMNMKNIYTRIIIRSETTKKWNEVNPILLLGELGIEFTENNKTKIKVGNGKDTWKDLEYISDYDKSLTEIEDELKFTQIAVIMLVIMNIILVSLFLCVVFG